MADLGPAQRKQATALRTVSPDISEEDVARILGDFVVAVEAPMPTTDPDASVTFDVLLNILPRIFPRIYVPADAPRHHPASHEARIIRGPPPRAPDLTLVTGAQATGGAQGRRLYVGNRGWTALLSTKAPPSSAPGPPNGIGAMYAAALAAAQAFNAAFAARFPRIQLVDGDYGYDLAKLVASTTPNHEPTLSQGFEIPSLLIVGVGAIGQALLQALRLVPRLGGHIRLVDHDVSTDSNEQRCVWAFPETRGQLKVHIAQGHFRASHPQLHVDTPLPPPWKHVVVDYDGYRLLTRGLLAEPLVVTALDHEQPRRDVQRALPETILNGWTETDNGLLQYGIGRHSLSGPWGCLACFHHPNGEGFTDIELAITRTGWPRAECERRLVDPSIKMTPGELAVIAKRLEVADFSMFQGKSLREFLHGNCGLASLRVDGKLVVASVTHVPVLVGCLLAAQVALHHLSGMSLEHLASYDALRLPTSDQQSTRNRDPRCMCSDAVVQEANTQLWGTTSLETGDPE